MESQEENDFDDSFTSQSTNGSAVVSGLVGNKGFVDGSGMDFNTTNPPHHDSSNLFNQYSMKSNSSSDFKNDAGLGATGSPNFSSASTSASPTSNSQSFPSNFSPNSFTSHQARLSGSGFRGLDGGSPRGSTSSMVSSLQEILPQIYVATPTLLPHLNTTSCNLWLQALLHPLPIPSTLHWLEMETEAGTELAATVLVWESLWV